MAKVVIVLCVCLCIQLVVGQFGFFPREERRYPSAFGLAQNLFNPRRISNTLSGVLHLQQENAQSNPSFIYPFQNLPISNDAYNQYRPNYPYQPNNNVRFPNQWNNGNNVNFEPQTTNDPYPQNDQNGYGFDNSVNGPNGVPPIISGQQNGPAFGDNTDGNNPSIISGQQNGPAFGENPSDNTPSIVSGEQNGPAFGGNTYNGNSPSIVSGEQNGPAFGGNTDNDTPSIVSGEQNGPAFGDNASTKSPSFVSGEQNGPAFGNPSANNPEDVTPPPFVSGQQNGPVFGNPSPYNPEETTPPPFVNGEQSGPVFGYKPEKNGVNPPSFEDRNGFTEAPQFDGTTRLPPLTPVPPSESRNNFNLGAQGIFKETCNTVDGGIGSCVSIVSCPRFVTLLQQARTNPRAVQELRRAHCGFEGNNPKVCCPLATIPNAPPPSAAPDITTAAPTAAPTSAPVTASGKSAPSDFLPAFPEPPVCGVSNASFSRVVGGVDAKLGDFPWMALLGYKGRRGSSTRWLCGGSLVSSHHVLTAAHCIHNHEDDLYVVRLGELDLAREDEGATPIDVLIKYKIKHEEYNAKAFTNDIGLLILDKDVSFTGLIKPICIPYNSELRSMTFEDYNPIIAGWGDTEFRGPSATHLQVLQLPVVSNAFCRKAYSNYTAQVIDKRVLCAGYKNGGKDACQGDSGGPLMQPIYNPKTYTTFFYQIGVVSYGKRCAEAGFPGVYSRVTDFVPWLRLNMLGTA